MKPKSLKRLVIIILMATALLPASAAINDTGTRLSDNPKFFVKEFCIDKTPRLYVGDRSESGGDEFTILDETFKEIGHFTIPIYPKVTASYSRAYGISEPADITVSSYDRPMVGSETKEEFVAHLNNDFTIAEEHGDETWYLASNKWYYYYDFFGRKYPTRVYIWNNATSAGVERNYDYQNGSWKPTGSYGEPQFYEDSHTPTPESMYPRDGSCVDNDNIAFTQTLFNKDENIEWIVPIVEAVECSYITQNYKYEGTQLFSTGFRVESQNGSVVTTVMFPTGMYAEKSPSPDFVTRKIEIL